MYGILGEIHAKDQYVAATRKSRFIGARNHFGDNGYSGAERSHGLPRMLGVNERPRFIIILAN